MNNNTRLLVGIVAALIIGGIGGWFISTGKVSSPIGSIAAQRLALPDNAEMYIPCIKGHGAHYSEPENIVAGPTNRPWVGPSYIVREDTGAVIGIEYHVSATAINQESAKIGDLVNRIVGGDTDIKLLYEHKFPVLGASYDSMDIFFIEGHPGFEVPHYDIHAWTLPKAEHASIDCPTA